LLNPPLTQKIFSITQLTKEIQTLLEESFPFIWITGEISNFKSPASGHYYFTLKDDQAQISAIMFRGQNRNLQFLPADGMKITGFGRINVYPPRGAYQIVLEYLEPAGTGALQAAFEQLKARLSQEGLFDERYKKPLPFLPAIIYLITSPTGSVAHDMIRVLLRRYPNLDIRIFPVSVQGDAAVDEIVEALLIINSLDDADLAIIARGGGSLEDLSAFNSEKVARAIFALRVPVISAIGHETDFTIADFVADLRAPTPSAAAELAVPVKAELQVRSQMLLKQLHARFNQYLEKRTRHLHDLIRRLVHPKKRLENLTLRLDDLTLRMTRAFTRSFARQRQQLAWWNQRLGKNSPAHQILSLQCSLADMHEKLLRSAVSMIHTRQMRISELTGRLHALNPAAVLDRGFSIARTLPDKTIIFDADAVSIGQILEILLAKGVLHCRVEKKEPPHGQKNDI